MFIRDVVGQLELVEGYRLGHPLLSGGRAVRVDVHPLGHLRVGLPRHHPAGVVELVAAVVGRHDVHQQDVFGFFIQAVYSHFEWGEHPPADTHRRGSDTRYGHAGGLGHSRHRRRKGLRESVSLCGRAFPAKTELHIYDHK